MRIKPTETGQDNVRVAVSRAPLAYINAASHGAIVRLSVLARTRSPRGGNSTEALFETHACISSDHYRASSRENPNNGLIFLVARS